MWLISYGLGIPERRLALIGEQDEPETLGSAFLTIALSGAAIIVGVSSAYWLVREIFIRPGG